mgnify:CR=1 FL=1
MMTAQLLKLIEHQAGLVTALSAQTVQMLIQLWSPFRNWTDHDLVLSQAARSATTVERAQSAARMRQKAYMKFVYRDMGIEYPTNDGLNQNLQIVVPGGVEIYPRGVNPLEVYQRPAEEFRYHVSTGMKEKDALVKALDRVTTMADTDLTLARREAMRDVYAATPTILGWRRIIHPELSKEGFSCGLCVVAADRVYSRGDLMPIHDECNCDTLPITEDNDPGRELNDDDLETLYDAAGGNTAADLLATKVHFLEHGELGPIISGGKRQGSKQRARAKSEQMDPEESFERQIEQLRKSSEKLLKRQAAGEDVRLSINWQRDRIQSLTRQLAAMRKIRK